MPIAVKCPSCAVEFKTKDEYAGKRAKCPKCAEPLTIPAANATPAAPAPVAARPVVTTKPKPAPVDDEPEEAPKPKRRLNLDDSEEPARPTRKRGTDDEDDAPVSPKRKRGSDSDDEEPASPKRKRGADSDEDDDKPRRRRRRDDDDDSPKKSKLPLILGILGGLFLLCAGGCAGVWFGVIVPGAEKAKKELDAMASDMKNRAGDGGPGVNPGVPTVLTPDELTRDWQKHQGKMVTVKGPAGFATTSLRGNPGGMDVFFALKPGEPLQVRGRVPASKFQDKRVMKDTPIELTGRVEGLFNNVYVDVVDCDIKGAASGPVPPVATLSAEQLAADWSRYIAKRVTVRGKLNTVVKLQSEPGNMLMRAGPSQAMIILPMAKDGWVWVPKAGDEVEVTGLVTIQSTDAKILMNDCTLAPGGGATTEGGEDTPIEVPADQLTAEFKSDVPVAVRKYYGKRLIVTGKVTGLGESPVQLRLIGPFEKQVADTWEVWITFPDSLKQSVNNNRSLGSQASVTGRLLSIEGRVVRLADGRLSK